MTKTLLSAAALLLLAACGGEPANNAQTASPSNAPAASSVPAVSDAAPAANPQGSLIERINNKGTITVGTEGTYAPFSYHDKDGKLTGYDVEVTRAVADKLGVKVEFRETQWDGMMAGLKAGRFDVVANQVGLTSPERQATFDKSEPYSWSGAVLVVRKDDNKIKSPVDIKGVKTAQSLTSNFGEKAKEAGAELVPVDGLAQSLTLIEQKRADATLNDELAVLDYLKKNANANVKIVWHAPKEERVGSGLITNKGNDEAIAKFSGAMKELQADGTLKKLGEQFFGKDISVK
nr:amino acid ABC transporter substrate-binding protein [uncultured Kingella sp.]